MSQTKPTALVLGASRGIGAAVATRFLAEGYSVAGSSRTGDVPEGVTPIVGDILGEDGRADKDSIAAIVREAEERLGGINTAVYCIGITKDGLLLRMPEEDMRQVLEVNLMAPMLLAQALLRPMVRRKDGSIVFVSSMSARFGVPGQTNYTASKAGLEGFTRSFAKEWASRGIRANAVAPGPTQTDMFNALTDDQKEVLLADTAVKRAATPEEIAEVVFHTSQHTFQTGSVVPVSGGGGYGY